MPLKDQIVNQAGLERKRLQRRVEQLETLVEAQAAQLRVKKPKIRLGRRRGKPKIFQRVIVPDTHGCFVDKAALAAFLRDLEALNPREIVLLGDHLDCAGWMAQHHPFKTIQEARYSFAEDVAAANAMLDAVQKRAPSAEYHYLEGNHEERIESWIVQSTAQHPADAAYLRQVFSPESVLQLDARKIKYYRRTERIGELRQRGVLKLGHCYFTHGSKHNKHAAKSMLDAHKCCIVFGHVHRRMQAGTSSVDAEMDAWCPGCLCLMEPIWKHSEPTEWSHGYGLQLVHADGTFLHLNIPIISGQSFLQSLVGV